MVLFSTIDNVYKSSIMDHNDYTLGLYNYPLGELTCVGFEPKGECIGLESNGDSLEPIQGRPCNIGMGGTRVLIKM